jgi:hypothetical protein
VVGKAKFEENKSAWRCGRLQILKMNAYVDKCFLRDDISCMYLRVPATKQHYVESDMWSDGWKATLIFFSEVFTSCVICGSHYADMCND